LVGRSRAHCQRLAVQADRRRPKARKLQANPTLLAEVLRRLRQRHSPEQIAGRLREDFPDDPEMWVSHETIYQAMYVQPRGELAKQVKDAIPLYEPCLPPGGNWNAANSKT
jgi:IS30 family transposase